MASPSTSSRLSERRNAVPLLLSSFPAPPTHIPVSPLVNTSPAAFPPSPPGPPTNPPLTAPPASPLPPIPGPSPISEHETLMFISAARGRRASKLSLASSSSHYSKRDSAASVMSASNSNASLPALSPRTSATHLDSSNRSIRSLSSVGSLSHSTRYGSDMSALQKSKIWEEDEDSPDLTRMSLDEINPSKELSDGEAESLLEFGILPPSLSKRSKRLAYRDHGFDDSISSIDMRDLPALEEDDSIPVPPKLPSSPKKADMQRVPSSSSLVRQYSVRRLNKELPPVPPPKLSHDALEHRSASPDIHSILASTPKPRRKSASSLGPSGHRSRSGSHPRRSSSHKGPKRHVSESEVPSVPITITIDSLKGRRSDIVGSELPYMKHDSKIDRDLEDNDSDSDYGVAVDATGTAIEIFDKELEDRLERQLEGDGSDSDSSIDIHTPLPHLMLRDGMLSPNSKLLPQRDATPQSLMSGRPGSMMSVASSVMTKSGIYKDQRDTLQRRVRHRDGRLLRGGIGLTTGLGWSDSEDEDAPSPLTRRISSVLSRKTSSNSISSGTLTTSRSVSDTLHSVSGSLEKHVGERSVPPTSWHHSSLRTSVSSTSTDSFNSERSARTSASSFSSSTASRRTLESSTLALDHIHEQEEMAHETSSNTSTSSIPMPPTPADDHASKAQTWPTPRKVKTSLSSLSSGKAPSLRRVASGIPPPGATRSRTISSSSNSSPAMSTSLSSPGSLPAPGPVPRPLRLPQSASLGSKPSASTSKPILGIARSSSESRSLAKSTTPRTRTASGGLGLVPPSRLARPSMPSLVPSQSAPSRPPPANERPKPRTGTGMIYRSSTRSGNTRASGMTLLRPPSETGADRSVGIAM